MLTSLARLLSLAQVWLTHSSSYSSNSSGPKTEMEIAHVEIPISNWLFRSDHIFNSPRSHPRSSKSDNNDNEQKPLTTIVKITAI